MALPAPKTGPPDDTWTALDYSARQHRMRAEWSEGCKAEDRKMRAWVSTHPWPSYESIQKRLLKDKRIDLWAEYGEFNHMALKLCYESFMDIDVCRKAGESIAARGGLDAMRGNYYVFSGYGPFADTDDVAVFYSGRQLEFLWEGIRAGGHIWRA